MSRMSRGALVIFEGVDRSGKSTQIKRIYEQMTGRGDSVFLTRFPERTSEIGQMINQYLKNNSNLNDRAIHLLFSANRWEHADLILGLITCYNCIHIFKILFLEKLKSGTTVLVDRYAYSGVAFTAAKGLDLEWCKNPDRGLPQPDLVLQLNISEDIAKNRGGFGEERYEKVQFQREVRKHYHTLATENSQVIILPNDKSHYFAEQGARFFGTVFI